MSGRGESAGVVLVIVVFISLCMWIAVRIGGGEQDYPVASSYSPAKAGSKALYELLLAAGIPVQRWGDTEYEYPPKSCVLVIEENPVDTSQTMGAQLDVKALAPWLEAGGRLVFASPPPGDQYTPVNPTAQLLLRYLNGEDLSGSGMFDLPPSAAADAGQDVAEMPAALAHADYRAAGQTGSNTATYRTYRPGLRFTLKQPRPRLFADVKEIETAEGKAPGINAVVPLLTAGDPPQPVVLFRQVGQGELYWVMRPEMLLNNWLARADNHRLVLALLQHASRNSTLYIDEHLHGYSRQHANAGSMLFQTLGGRLILGAGLALALCFCGAAVRPARFQPQPVPQRRTVVEMVEAQAGLFRRAGMRRGIVERLLDGVRRTYMHTYAHSTLPSNDTLGLWARKYAIDGDMHASVLTAYLADSAVPRGQAELVKLGRACDWARMQLEKERNG